MAADCCRSMVFGCCRRVPPRVVLYGFCASCLFASYGVQVALSSGHQRVSPYIACSLRLSQRFRSLEGLVLVIEALVVLPIHLMLRFLHGPIQDAIPAVDESVASKVGSMCVCPAKGQLMCLLSVPSSSCIETCAEHIDPAAWASARFSAVASAAFWSPSLESTIAMSMSFLTVAVSVWSIVWMSQFIKQDMHYLFFGGSLPLPEAHRVRFRISLLFSTKLLVALVRPLVCKSFWLWPTLELDVYLLRFAMEFCSELYWFTWTLLSPVIVTIFWLACRHMAYKMYIAFHIIATSLDEMRELTMKVHICRLHRHFAQHIFNIKKELSYMWCHSPEGEADICAICLEDFYPREVQAAFVSGGARPRTSLERLRPRFRAAVTTIMQPRPVLVRMGPCQHVFHRDCFSEVARHKQCPSCDYAFLQCPTCRAELTQMKWWAPACLQPVVEYVISKVNLYVVNRLVSAMILMMFLAFSFKLATVFRSLAARILGLPLP